MPSYTFTDADNTPENIPNGDYILEVIDMEDAIAKASGNDMVVVKCREAKSKAVFIENLVLTPKAFWKIDVFLKSLGCKFKKGEEVVLNKELLMGRRGWAKVELEAYKEKQVSRIQKWYTDKGLVDRNPEAVPQSDEDDFK